jgi:hypothetical protein
MSTPPLEWHTYRRDHQLTGHCSVAGNIVQPRISWTYQLGGTGHEVFTLPGERGTTDLLIAVGGGLMRYDASGGIVWKSACYGLNAIACIADLDGDGSPEIVASSGYEVFVFSSRDARLLLRDYVGFPASAGAPANTILCHRFDPHAAGMHLVVPLMSAREVRVYDFRRGAENALPATSLWMDDAYHPTIAAADLDHDGVDELVVSKLCGIYTFDVLAASMKSSVQWTSNGERHRNYGLMQFHDIDGDGDLELVIAADRVARHFSVLDNDGKGNFRLLWDRFVEFIYPSDTTELRHTWNSVSDVDADGRLEIVVSLFNDRKDGRWWLEVIDPLTGRVKAEMADRYLWGVQDLDGDTLPEILVSQESGRQTQPYGTVEVLSCRDGVWQTRWSGEGLHFAGKDMRPKGRISEFRPALFGHNETWVEHNSMGTRTFMFARPSDGNRSSSEFVELTCTNGKFSKSSKMLTDAPGVMMAQLADLDGDMRNERVLSDNAGGIHVLGDGGEIKASFRTGFRLPLEAFSVARPAQIPVVYRSRGSALPFISVIDNTNTAHQLQVNQEGSGVRNLWRIPGRGLVGYDLAFHSSYVTDVDQDGEPELLFTAVDSDNPSTLVAYDPEGQRKGSWAVPGAPPTLPVRIGAYQWQVLSLQGKNHVVAAYFASYSMNSEQSVCFDLERQTKWHLTQYGEGDWGRGMGPWSAYSSLPGKDGTFSLFFLAKDMVCEVDPATGRWLHEPWLLWHATTVAMGQPDWDFTKDRLELFGTVKDPFTAYGSVVLMDVDGDGEEELVIGGCFGGMGVLKKDHSVLWWMQTPFTDVMMRVAGVADLSGHGNMGVGICHANGQFVCYDGRTGKELWSCQLGASTSDTVSCDIDGDGREEFILGTADGKLLAIGEGENGTGMIKWSVDLGTAVGTPTIADACGTGRPQVLVVAGDGVLYCIAGSEEQEAVRKR